MFLQGTASTSLRSAPTEKSSANERERDRRIVWTPDFQLRHVKWVQLKLLGESDPVDKYISPAPRTCLTVSSERFIPSVIEVSVANWRGLRFLVLRLHNAPGFLNLQCSEWSRCLRKGQKIEGEMCLVQKKLLRRFWVQNCEPAVEIRTTPDTWNPNE